MVTAFDIDAQLLSPAYVASPYATYDLLRAEAPVYWSAKWSAWLVTRYDDAIQILLDYRRFSNVGRYTQYLSQLPQTERQQLAYLLDHYEHGGLVQSDPPDHTRLRRLVNAAFTPRAVARMRGLVEQTADRLLDAAQARGRFDLVRDFAFPLPAIVIAAMLGAPADERDRFKEWSSNIQQFLGSGDAAFPAALRAQRSWQEMNAYFAALLTERQRQPQNDIISALAAAREGDDALGEHEIVGTAGAMQIAGHETTTNLIASGTLALLTHPEQLAAWRAEPSLDASAVEEFLRFDSPFQSVPRRVTQNTVLRGMHLAVDDLVYVMLGAANRDPAQFRDPATLDIRRGDGRQIAFGHGIHHCLGAALARLEAPIALRRLFDRLPTLHVVPDAPPLWKRSMGQRGLERFTVTG